MTKHGKLTFLSTLLSALGASALTLAGACSSPFESCAENKVCPIESGAGAPGADTGEETTGGSTSVGTSGSTGAGTSGTGPGVSEGGSGASGDSSAAAGSSSECPDGMSCAACESDARRCLDENTPEQCVDGNFQPQARCGAAAPFCLEGACVSCQPEDMRCSLNTLETCASDGSGWETAEVCTGDTPACLSESGECGRCTEGDTDCSGNTPQACNGEGAWEPLAPCEGETPVCASGECLACAPDATRCTDDGLEVCDADGSWESSSCPDETPVCLDDACVACEPGATACLDDSTVQQCAANGDWLSGQACSGDTPYCVGGSCNECSPGDMRCGDAVTPQLCNDAGGWESQPACGNENPACYEGDCVACTPGAKRCSQNAPQVCKEDGTAWEGSDACSGDTPACLQATGECGSCTEGDRQCDGDTPQVCDDMGVFQDQAPCGGGAPQCLPATGECAECDPAEGTGRGCANSTTPQSCSAEGQWQIEESCSGDTPVCLEPSGTCGCDSGRRCNGNTPQLCVNGTWSAQGMCSGMTPMCQEETGMCGCAEDSERCQSGVAQQCQGGTWTSLSGCAGETVNCGGCEIGESCGGDGDCDSGHCSGGECAPEVVQLAGGFEHACARFSDGRVKCWGALTHTTIPIEDTPEVIIGDTEDELGENLAYVSLPGPATDLAAGTDLTCAVIDTDLWCWGTNYAGQLGQGSTDVIEDPVRVDVGGPVVSSAIGAGFACALLQNGQVRCWGKNTSGQLGIGSTEVIGDEPGEMGSNLAPVQLGGSVQKLSAGDGTVCAVTQAGSVKCWGSNIWGGLGTGSRQTFGDDAGEVAPVAVDLGQNFVAEDVAVGVGHVCALSTNRQVKCWGYNGNGRLGLGDIDARGDETGEMGDNLPVVPVPGSPTTLWTEFNHPCVLLQGQGLVCWGNAAPVVGNPQLIQGGNDVGDENGEIANLTPIDFGTGLRPTHVAGGRGFACALLNNGDVKCWGFNRHAELGIGNTNDIGDDIGEMGNALQPVLLF